MLKKNVFVFPCGSEIGLDIYNVVKYSRFFHLIGGSSVDDHGRFVYDDYIGGIPFVTEDSFIPRIKELVKEREIDLIYPAMDSVITFLKQHEGELGCKVVSSPVETTEISLSKERTYRKLLGVVRIPNIYQVTDDIPYPVFIKPKVGYGAKGTGLVHNKEELLSFVAGRENKLLIVDYLPGEEFTVDCFTDRHGVLRYVAARGRNRIKDGISVNTTFTENQIVFYEYAESINRAIKFRGAWFFQVKKTYEGELCLLEVASRFGGSSLLSCAIGVNLPLLSIFDALDYDVSIDANTYYVELDRALDNKYKTDIVFDTVYVDYDDCLILDKQSVNVELISFLYQCTNKGKKVVLLSKHDGNLENELHQFRIYEIFDEIIHIGQSEDKCNYMTAQNAVFIDDSFAERSNVKTKKGYPVFSPEMVKVLTP